MSQENVEIVRRGYEAFNSGDLDLALALFDPDVEVLMAEEPGQVSLLDLSRSYRGVEGFIAFLGQMAEAWGEFRWVPERYFDAGGEVVVFIRLTAEGKSSGAPVDQSMAHLCTMRDGKLVRHETFWKREAALEAAGLSERAMSEQNIELIRRSYAAFNHRDLAAMLRLMHPDFELDFSGSLGPERGVYAGEEGIRRLFEPYWEAFESISIEPEEFIGSGDVIIAMVRARGRGEGSGAEVDARGPHMWSFRDGKIVGFALYQELEEALEAAGLRE